jgi:peroxiredoxin
MKSKLIPIIILVSSALITAVVAIVVKTSQSSPTSDFDQPTLDVKIPAGKFFIGDKLPDFSATDGEGNTFQLSQALDGEHFVVVNFHHPDCPCSVNCSRLINSMMDEGTDDITVVGLLSSGYDDERVLNALQDQRDEGILRYAVYFDPDQKLKERFGATRTPEAWVLDKEGYIRYYGAPESTLFPRSKDYRPLLKEALVAMRENKTPEIQAMRSIGCPIE